MNFKKRVNGSWVDTPNYIHKTATDTITTLPAVIYPTDTTATVGLKGNMYQASGVSPTTPIQPSECGERTGNLINVYANDTSNGYINNALIRIHGDIYTPSSAYVCEYQPINEGVTYTLNTGGMTGDAQSICFYTRDKQFISGVAYESRTIITFTTPQGARYFRCTIMRSQADVESYKHTMLNAGSTALPYEPYGIKIPISSGGENLVDESASSDVDATHINYNKSLPIILTAGQTYTFSCNTVCNGMYIRNVVDDSNLASANNSSVLTYTPQVNVRAYCRIWNANGITNLNPMLNLGATALPYEPYIEPTETSIYLGEVQTTRRIRELVLDGTENWVSKGNPATFRYENSPIPYTLNNSVCYCSHFKNLPWQQVITTNNSFTVEFTSKPDTINIRCDDYSTVEDFKAFLAQQYTNGTPVTVWYVLATPETGIVNEPLRKIGDYADEVANVSIPITAGEDTLSVSTTVQPSEVTATYKGWHPVADVHERDNGAWT